jgi:hypothetical protein
VVRSAVPSRAWALVLLVQLFLSGILGCGRAAKPAAWIGDRAAVIRCTGAGPLRMPPVLLGLPVPPLPTGLLAHAMDPSSLDGLGYERDATVCAVLEAPSADAIENAKATLPALVEAYDAVSREALRVGGRCTCEIARELGERDMVAACLQTPTMAGCDVEAKSTEVARALDPLREALAQTELPWNHWRLVGATDRPGWFAAHLPDLLERHTGGSTAYLRGEPLPARAEPLVRDLLALEGVVAVVRQDSGRAILIARERDGLLVLDHFAQPPMLARLGPLVKRLEQTRSVALVSRLTPSAATQPPMGRPQDGNFVEIDRAMLEELDRVAIAASALLGPPYQPNAAVYQAPPVLVDRVLVQAPFGADGQRLVVRARLSAEGIAWAQTLGGAALAPNIDALGLLDQSPKYTPPPNSDVELPLRGTETETILIHGISRMPTLMRAIEQAHPGALGGSLSHWKIDLEGGDPAPSLAGTSLAKLREHVAAGKYELEMDLADGRTILELDLHPE